MTLSRLGGGVRILRRDPLHRVPGCWYLKDSRMLHDLDDRTVEAMARESSMGGGSAGREAFDGSACHALDRAGSR